MKRLKDAFEQGHVILDLDASDMATAIRETVSQMVAQGTLSEQVEEEVVSALLIREQESPTALGHAMAIPHAYFDGIEQQTDAPQNAAIFNRENANRLSGGFFN